MTGIRRPRLTDDECMAAVHEVVMDGEHHTFPEILTSAEFVTDDDEGIDLGVGQIRRGLATLQDTLTDAIFASFVCHDESHNGKGGRPFCVGQWVYQESEEVDLGQLYALRTIRTGLRYLRKSAKSFRQLIPKEDNAGRRRLERDMVKDVVTASAKGLPVLASLAAEQGISDAVIDKMIERVMLDST